MILNKLYTLACSKLVLQVVVAEIMENCNEYKTSWNKNRKKIA